MTPTSTPAARRRPSRMRRAERSESSGSRAAHPLSTLDRSTPALAHTKPWRVSDTRSSPRRRRIRTDSSSTTRTRSAGSSGSTVTSRPSAFETIFWVTTTTSPSSSSAAAGDHGGQVVAPGDLAQPVDGQHMEAGHATAPDDGPRSPRGPEWRGGARTTVARDAACRQRVHDRRGHHAAHAGGGDVVGERRVGLVDDQGADHLGRSGPPRPPWPRARAR